MQLRSIVFTELYGEFISVFAVLCYSCHCCHPLCFACPSQCLSSHFDHGWLRGSSTVKKLTLPRLVRRVVLILGGGVECTGGDAPSVSGATAEVAYPLLLFNNVDELLRTKGEVRLMAADDPM